MRRSPSMATRFAFRKSPSSSGQFFVTMTFDKKTVLAIQGNKIVAGDQVRHKDGQPKAGRGMALLNVPMWEHQFHCRHHRRNRCRKNTLGILTGRADELRIQSITVGKEVKAKVLFEGKLIK